jgi:hypothetical protein
MDYVDLVPDVSFDGHTPKARVEFGTPFRRRRLQRFIAAVDDIIAAKGSARILDLGGTSAYWETVKQVWENRPVSFTLVNLAAEPVQHKSFVSLAGSACELPDFADNSFDIVHSNSVIEHVRRWEEMRAMASEVRRLAPRYFIQTPAYGFPIEPHFRTPFFHWLPEPLRIRLLMSRSLGFFPKARDTDEAMRFLEYAVMIDRRRFVALFPDAEIVPEKFMGLTKSFVAIR